MLKNWTSRIGLALALSGCASVDHNTGNERWFNPSLPIHLQHTLYLQEQAYCTQAADRWIPIPDVHFSFEGARYINGVPNVSVEGTNTAVTTGAVSHSLVATAAVSEAGFWKTIAANSKKGYREARHELQCMTALGWFSTSDTWDGTPSYLNESIAVNKAVMESVERGYSHPLLGTGVMALIDVGSSYRSATEVVLYTTELPLYAPENRANCVYKLEPSYFSMRGFVRCSGGSSQPVTISSNSPISHWMREYF